MSGKVEYTKILREVTLEEGGGIKKVKRLMEGFIKEDGQRAQRVEHWLVIDIVLAQVTRNGDWKNNETAVYGGSQGN